MKKHFITLFIMLVCTVSFAQSAYLESVSNKMISQMNAVVLGRQIENNDQLVFASTPSFYTLELVVFEVKQVIDNDDKASFLLPWEKEPTDPVFYSCIVKVHDDHLYIRYTPSINQLLFIYPARNN